MKLFQCQSCGQMLYFENTHCERCGRRLGYLPETGTLSALEEDGNLWRALAFEDQLYRFCVNAGDGACNWLVSASAASSLCAACRHNRMIPDLSNAVNLARWQRLELAKHHLFYSLFRLGLPLPTRPQDPSGLAFDFLADPPDDLAPKITTGHADGLITINIKEADDAERERMRSEMGEPYRTLLGHFRHEVGHFFWDRLVRDRANLASFRALFGDEREDYGEALQRHYAIGGPANWQEHFVSNYASAHPWEDFAETWSHYLHIVDTLEMAGAFGLRVRPRAGESTDLKAAIDFDPYRARSASQLIDAWLPITFALNSLNRCMGQPDLYPFVLPPAVMEKLGYIHELVRGKPDRPPLRA